MRTHIWGIIVLEAGDAGMIREAKSESIALTTFATLFVILRAWDSSLSDLFLRSPGL